jgi:hypothetical protein
MTVKDLKTDDLIELFGDSNFRRSLTDEFDINIKEETFVFDEDSDYIHFRYISKIWREDGAGNYILIYVRKKEGA